jgi:hypothetical protein
MVLQTHALPCSNMQRITLYLLEFMRVS